MTHDKIVRIAREAGFGPAAGWAEFFPLFERFADLVAAAEREACAQACDGLDAQVDKYPAACAAAIRARGTRG